MHEFFLLLKKGVLRTVLDQKLASKLSISRRVIFHLLLAVFLANAANKFFVADLDAELAHGFYARIFDFVGDAPDQYRILPLLPLKLLCNWLPFNHAVLVFNAILGFVCFELLWVLYGTKEPERRMLLNLGFAVCFIYAQYTGWRPDTLALMALCLGFAVLLRQISNAKLKIFVLGLGVLALSFSRAEIAFIYAIFFAFFLKDLRLVIFAIIPIIAHFSLQLWIFPSAHYYTKPFMLWDNLRLHFLLHNPATYLILAVIIGFWSGMLRFLRKDIQKNLYFYILLVGYFGLVLLVGRVNEFRLYMPFLPLFLLLLDGKGERKGN